MERLYTIPLRREFSKAPNYKRTSKAIKAIRKFIEKHMKSDNVKIGKHLNLEIWKHGRKNPPARIKVKAIKEKIKEKDQEIEYVIVELPHIEIKPVEKKKKKKKEEKKEEVTDEHKVKEEKEKKEVLEKKEVKKEEPKQSEKAKPQKTKPLEKNIIGRTSKK